MVNLDSEVSLDAKRRPMYSFTVDEENIYKTAKELKKRDVVAGFVSHTSLHGVGRIYGSYGYIKKVFWILATMTTLAMCCNTIVGNVQTLLSWDVNTNVMITSRRELDFPAITVCNVNPLKLSSVPQRLLNYLQNSSLTSGVYDNGPHGEDTGLGSTKHSRLVTQEVMSELLAKETIRDRTSWGYSFNEFVLTCDFSGYDCSSGRQWVSMWNWKYGNCYTFNANTTRSARQSSHRTGPDYGLRLVLNTDVDEYVPELSAVVGARVLVHDHSHMPFPEDVGFTVAPGTSAGIGVRQTVVQRLGGGYYGYCQDTTVHDYSLNVYEELYSWTNYSQSACDKTCWQKMVIENCGCFDPNYPSVGQAFTDSTTSPCSLYNQTEVRCKETTKVLYLEEASCTQCIMPCNETTYDLTISSTTWPAPTYQLSLLSTLNDTLPIVKDIQNGTALLGANLMQVEIYYEELNYETITESAAYSTSMFLSDLGGAAGLWIGASVLTVAEVIELLIDYVSLIVIKYCIKDKRSNSVDLSPYNKS